MMTTKNFNLGTKIRKSSYLNAPQRWVAKALSAIAMVVREVDHGFARMYGGGPRRRNRASKRKGTLE
jgi:protein-arginine kinase